MKGRNKKGNYKQKNFNSKKNFKKPQRFEKPAAEAQIDEISQKDDGSSFIVQGLIDRIVQTAGPTLFSLNDGTGTLMLKGFDGPGVRAHPEIIENSLIKATISIKEFNNALEGEISKIEKLSGSEEQKAKKKLSDIERSRASITPPAFLVKSPILDKLKSDFTKAATEIRLAVVQNRPIIVRHHNDTDGYSSGFSLEKAIIPLIEKQHGPGKAPWEYFTRAPCSAPFYEIDDSIRDTAKSLSDEAKFANKMPLVIIADNGSSQQDLLGIQQGKVHGMEFIVIDHHVFEEDVISKEVLVHINPFLVKEDGSKFSAGMLCAEISRFINPEIKNMEQIAAMAGLADRIDNSKVIDDYLKLAKAEGYTKSLLSDIATVIDFVSAKLRFMEAREYIEVLFGEPMAKQKSLVALMAPYIRNLESQGLEIAKSAASTENIGSATLQLLPIEETFPRGFYPKPGKATGQLHDSLQEKTPVLVTAGVMPDAITIRATDQANFSVHDYIAFVNKKVPGAFAEGGGHKNAGALRFLPSKQPKVLEALKDFIKSNQN
ncbi:hypothetical protein CMI47_05730 [Candidatus Pacearchaeota archaeon]|nr:hypothetical protein [Candidatus Pacearchaeota archaeon]|tara:strand:- start:818 stop:2452 length:1635 start_codon:yes stop_codon:yes gene_type:complete